MWPTICVDNFFNDPDKVFKFANSLKYTPDNEGRWPGERSDELHKIDRNFFEFFGKKVLSILYPMEAGINFSLRLTFQKISKKYTNEGWVHKDNGYINEFTSIVYLSKHKECGTSLFDSKKIHSFPINEIQKRDTYLKDNFKEENIYLKENNNQFEETISIKSKYNRFIMFDSSQLHAAQKFTENTIEEDRLTLVGFFENVYFPNIKLNGVQHKRI
jgi:hypothetical protein